MQKCNEKGKNYIFVIAIKQKMLDSIKARTGVPQRPNCEWRLLYIYRPNAPARTDYIHDSN